MVFGKKKRRRTRNILIVEDEPLVAFDTEHFLDEQGFAIVATTDSVAEAIQTVEGEAPVDLILADVNLSDGSGIDVARAARIRDIPVLFVTGNCPGEAQDLAAGCLSKPYTQRQLIAAIDAVEAVAAGRKPRRLPANLSLFQPAA